MMRMKIHSVLVIYFINVLTSCSIQESVTRLIEVSVWPEEWKHEVTDFNLMSHEKGGTLMTYTCSLHNDNIY